MFPREVFYVLSQTEEPPGADLSLKDSSTTGRKVWDFTQGQLLRSKSYFIKDVFFYKSGQVLFIVVIITIIIIVVIIS